MAHPRGRVTCCGLIALAGVLFVGFSAWVVLSSANRSRVAVEQAREVRTAVPRPDVPAPPSGPAIAPGTPVEITGRLLFDSLSHLSEWKAAGRVPAGYAPGREYFGVPPGSPATVLEQSADAVRVRIDGVRKSEHDGWAGREGWIAVAGVRVPVTPEATAADVVDGLTLDVRREIYGGLYRGGMLATYAADRQFPVTVENSGEPSFLRRREQYYNAQKKKGRQELVAKYRVDGSTLDRIDAEGMAKAWPLPEVERPAVPAPDPAPEPAPVPARQPRSRRR